MASKIVKLMLLPCLKTSSNFRPYSKISNQNGTVDTSEIDHFNNLAEQWWSLEGPLKPLHLLNPLRTSFTIDSLNLPKSRRLSKKPLQDTNIVEVGCGGGLLTEALAKLGACVTGVDASDILINIARSHLSMTNDQLEGKITYCNDTIENFALKNRNKFDVLICSEVIEHITEKEPFLEAAVMTVKPGGSFVFTTFNRTFSAWFMGIFLPEYVTGTIAKGTHTYDKFISPKQLQRILENYNCKTVKVNGLLMNPFTGYWHWSPWMVSYALQAVKN